jgi:OmpA-OmpF porin, OOP family
LQASKLFAFGSAKLQLPQPELDRMAEVLARNPQVSNVVITGHTDRLGSASANQRLSQQRADGVKAYLVGKGVAPGRVTAKGEGASRPVVQCSQKQQAALIKCLEPNRRVEVEPITVTKP